MHTYPTLTEADLQGKKVLLRAGFDLPLDGGVVVDTSRVEALVPTMRYILDNGAALIIMAHQGRPKGEPNPDFSQKPVVPVLEELLETKVQFADSCTGDVTRVQAENLQPGEVLLLENLRYDPREKKNDPEFAQELAGLADLYVNDAFTNCHRPHASMIGVPEHLPSYMGLQLQAEVENLSKALTDAQNPVTLIVAGAKMETKVPVIEHYLSKGDHVLLGGCIANSFAAAKGYDVGASKYEEEEIPTAQDIMLQGEAEDKADVHVPTDAVVASSPDATEILDLPLEDIEGDMAIFDVGTQSLDAYEAIIESSNTIIWNGPLGFYEKENFSGGSKRIAEALQKATERGAFTVIGGGDTIDFHKRYNYDLDSYSFVSTGGGAMLEFIVGKELPALVALQKN